MFVKLPFYDGVAYCADFVIRVESSQKIAMLAKNVPAFLGKKSPPQHSVSKKKQNARSVKLCNVSFKLSQEIQFLGYQLDFFRFR